MTRKIVKRSTFLASVQALGIDLFICRASSEINIVSMGVLFFFQAEDGIRDSVASRGLGDVYKRQIPQRIHILKLERYRED